MTQHSRWKAESNGDGTHYITAGSGEDIADTRAHVDEEDHARLIAAAPDLLQAARCAVAAIDKTMEINHGLINGYQASAKKELLEALAKATAP